MPENFNWYIVHALSGYEKRIAQIIKEQADKKNLSDLFEQIIVPVEGVIEVRKGQKINAERKFLPGYILVKMVMNELTWHLVKNIPKVTGFLGSNGKPQPIPEKEVNIIFKQIEEGTATPKQAITFEIGESVRVIDGPFDSFVGVVEEVDLEKNRLKVSVSIFGRSTPVELEYTQVAKV
jgi:transcriptional antiterminator NusG